MIVTCASCLTKYHLDDSRVSEKGAKVRCSRCKHVFYVVRPPESQEQVAESFESFARFHQELIGTEQPEGQRGMEEEEEEERVAPSGMEGLGEEREGEGLFTTPPPSRPAQPFEPPTPEEAKSPVQEPPRKAAQDLWKVRRRRPRFPRFLALLAIVTILLLTLFYLWTELKSGGRLATSLSDPIGKVTRLWEKLWGIESEGLVLKDLVAHEEKVGELSLYIIEGKVTNQSTKLKRFIKVKVTIFDQNKIRVAEKEALCGPTLNRSELKNLPASFFAGDMVLQPKTEKETMLPPGSGLPFMVLFKELPPQAKEFKVEIVEAPSV
ncbi:MAG: zinc-ribbon domain-containing protein [Desulfobacterota bacterium]|nr:zinc-ribbon domain-containing protein [Thermodesulfobacteriota bacterium]